MSESVAFLEHNFSPIPLRRNIAVLGLLHKRVLGQAHISFDQLLPWYTDGFPSGRGFGHDKALYGHWAEVTHHRQLFNRSIFSMSDIYNNLPQFVVDCTSVKEFQSTLTARAKQRCRDGCAWWADTFDCRVIRIQQQ